MNFIKKLFGTNSSNSASTQVNAITTTNPERTIFDIFEIDIKNIPDETFVEGETEDNASAQEVQNFRKSLNYKEFGIFDTVEVKVIVGTNKNVFFKSSHPDQVNFNDLKNLIDKLYLIHGNDIDGKGKFTIKDKEDYNDIEFYMLFGRSWTDFPKYKYPVSVTRDEEYLSIAIWGVDN